MTKGNQEYNYVLQLVILWPRHKRANLKHKKRVTVAPPKSQVFSHLSPHDYR